MPVNWDDAKERQLLLAIIAANPVSPNWDDVANMLNAQTGTTNYIGNALRQKFAKLKKNATDQYGDFGAAANAAPTPAKKTTKRKSAKKEDDEDGEEEGSAAQEQEGQDKQEHLSSWASCERYYIRLH